MTIIDRWNFSWDLNPGPPQRIDGGNNSSWQTWRYSSGKRKSSKISQRRCISTSDIAYFSTFATPLCLSASCYPFLPLQAIVLTENIVSTWKFPSIPFIFAATFDDVIRRNLKLLANTNVVIMAVWMGSPQTLHTRSCDAAASVARQHSLTCRTYGTEAVSVISTIRKNRYRPDLFPDVAQCQNNTSYIKPFRTNALVLYCQ